MRMWNVSSLSLKALLRLQWTESIIHVEVKYIKTLAVLHLLCGTTLD